MYCKKCGFITKGRENSCPYCGSTYYKETRLDQKKIYFNWLELSLRQIINIILVNIFLIIAIIDIILKTNNGINSHLIPWSFICVSIVLVIFNDFIPFNTEKKQKFLYMKSIIVLILSGFFLIYSYAGKNFVNESITHSIFGYYYPIGLVLIMTLGTISIFFKKNYNMLSAFICVLVSIFISIALLILTLTNVFELSNDAITKTINIFCFAFVILISINNLFLTYLKIKSKFSIRG